MQMNHHPTIELIHERLVTNGRMRKNCSVLYL
jgi:hypothetical protein